MTQPTPDPTLPTFELNTVGVKAQGRPTTQGKFLVLAGSQARTQVTDGYKQHATVGYQQKRQDLLDSGLLVSSTPETLVLQQDTEFRGSTEAAVVLLGRNTDGTQDWFTTLPDGSRQTHKQWLAQQPPQSGYLAAVEPVKITWSPFFHELAQKVLEYEQRQPELVQVLIDSGIRINHDEGQPLQVIDPFSFFSLILKHNSDPSALGYFAKVGQLLGITAPVPTELIGVPWSNPMNAWFFPYESQRKGSDLPTLWALARQAMAGELRPDTFEQTLDIRKVGLPKLTQGLFWLNPQQFLALNGVNIPYLRELGLKAAGTVKTLSDYQQVLEQARQLAPDFPSLSHAAWLWSQQGSVTIEPTPGPGGTVSPGPAELFPKIALNQILYGPPGTGKTYHVVEEAVRILDPEFLEASPNRSELKAHYDWLDEQGSISFVTFHQSFGYEDFVEGIKPVLEGGQLRYDVQDGIFLEAVKAAGGQLQAVTPSTVPLPPVSPVADVTLQPGAQVWRIYLDGTAPVSQIRDKVLQRGEMRVGHFGMPPKDWNTLDDEDLKGSALLFRDGIRIGDLILLATGIDQIGAVGIVTGDYTFEPHTDPVLDTEFVHTRKVNWLATGLHAEAQAITGRRFAPPTLQRVASVTAQEVLQRLSLAAQTVGAPQSLPEPRRHVLIIDEINRGNIAKIFGELITLLEDGKRAGQKEALKVKLPLSRRVLGVSDTLYVIGTMNTADRSLTQLDTALRRRFIFRPVWPQPYLLPVISLEEGQLDLAEFLGAINRRIERLLSREQVIGHAYLLGLPATLSGVASALRERILPQLEEYFFDDWAKIREVLGDNKKPEALQFIWEEVTGTERERRYQINDAAFKELAAYQRVYTTQP